MSWQTAFPDVLVAAPHWLMAFRKFDVNIHARHELDNEAFGYLKRVIVTPAVYPRLVEYLRSDIQSTWQKSRCVKNNQ